MLGIAPIVYPSIRRGGPGGADRMLIDPSRAMSATLPSKQTGEAFRAVAMRTACRSHPGADNPTLLGTQPSDTSRGDAAAQATPI